MFYLYLYRDTVKFNSLNKKFSFKNKDEKTLRIKIINFDWGNLRGNTYKKKIFKEKRKKNKKITLGITA